MFEIGVFCVILFALGYWATLFIMGRRADVLHGEFVEAEPELASASAGVPMPLAKNSARARLSAQARGGACARCGRCSAAARH